MNSAAVSRVGQSNLQNLNSGGENLQSDNDTQTKDVVDKLEDLIDISKNKVGDINITVNGGGKGEGSTGGSGNEDSSSESGEGGSDERKRIAGLIKEQVLSILQDEQRLGGQLRRR